MEVDRILSQVDTNNNGLIDYSEFLVANTRIEDYLRGGVVFLPPPTPAYQPLLKP